MSADNLTSTHSEPVFNYRSLLSPEAQEGLARYEARKAKREQNGTLAGAKVPKNETPACNKSGDTASPEPGEKSGLEAVSTQEMSENADSVGSNDAVRECRFRAEKGQKEVQK